jgi:hypothetical protein
MVVRVMTAALTLASVTTIAHAVQPRSSDDQELRTVKLTMERVQQVDRAMTALAKAVQSDPALQAKIKRRQAIESGEAEPTAAEEAEMMREEAEEEEDGQQTITSATREIEREPKFVAALRSAGLTPREFVLTQTALFQASFAHGAHKLGQLKEIPKEIPPEHVDFVATHEQELAAMWKRWQEIGKQLP